MAQVALPIVAMIATEGAEIAVVALATAAASAAGAYLDRTYLFPQSIEVGDSNAAPDLQQTAEGGAAISLLGTRCRVRGQVLWQSSIVDVGGVPTVSVAIAFSTDHDIQQLNTVKAEGFTVYDVTAQVVVAMGSGDASLTWFNPWFARVTSTDQNHDLTELRAGYGGTQSVAMTGWTNGVNNIGAPPGEVIATKRITTSETQADISATGVTFVTEAAASQTVTITQSFSSLWNSVLIANVPGCELRRGFFTDPLSTTMQGYESEVYAWGGRGMAIIDQLKLTQFGLRLPEFVADVQQSSTDLTLKAAVEELHDRAGWDGNNPGQRPVTMKVAGITDPRPYDTSGLATDRIVTGYSMRGSQSLAKRLEPLMMAYDFVMQVRNGTPTYFHPEDRRVWQVPGDHCTAFAFGGTGQPSIAVEHIAEPSLPTKVTVRYVDADTFDDAAQHYHRSAHVKTTDTTLEVNWTSSPAITLSAAEAREIAERLCRRPWRERRKVRCSLMPKWHVIEENDAIETLDPDGNYVVVVITKVEKGANWLIPVEGYIQEDEDWGVGGSGFGVDEGGGADGSAGSESNYGSAPTVVSELANLPPLSPGDEEAPTLYAFAANADVRASATPTVLQVGTSDEGWADLAAYAQESTMGFVASSSGCGAEIAGQTDHASVIDVELRHGELASATADDVQEGANLALVGDEILSFQAVEALGDDVYRLTTLSRGLMDTDSAAHNTAGERFVLLDRNHVAMRTTWSEIGATKTYRGIATALRDDLDAGIHVDHEFLGLNMRPWRVFGIAGTIDGGNDWDLTWKRKTRQPRESILSGFDVDPDPSDYAVVVYADGTFTTEKRTITVTGAEAATYTSAEQVTDFGSNQGTLYLGVSRVNTWGTGREVQATLT